MPLDEFEIIEKYFKHLTPSSDNVVCGIGDDGAVVEVPHDEQLVVSVDTMVSGVHFFPDVLPFDLGYKSLAVNLSDLAAMAATPSWATLSLTLPNNDPDWLEAFASGFSDLAGQYDVQLVGGDLSHGPLSVTVQVMGTYKKGGAIRRNGAKAGDDVYISGHPGIAAYALKILSGQFQCEGGPPEPCLARLLRPEPRLELALTLPEIAGSAIDVSDGLASDLAHILNASTVGATIMLENIPLTEELKSLQPDQLWQSVLCGGDDYELCFTAAKKYRDQISSIAEKLTHPVTRIGEITEGKGISWMLSENESYQLISSGYQHFTN